MSYAYSKNHTVAYTRSSSEMSNFSFSKIRSRGTRGQNDQKDFFFKFLFILNFNVPSVGTDEEESRVARHYKLSIN